MFNMHIFKALEQMAALQLWTLHDFFFYTNKRNHMYSILLNEPDKLGHKSQGSNY